MGQTDLGRSIPLGSDVSGGLRPTIVDVARPRRDNVEHADVTT